MATDRQLNFIYSLVDQFGYKDSPHKENFLNKYKIREESNISVQDASDMIDWLLKLNKIRKFSENTPFNKDTYRTVRELSTFAFCPASYSIKKTCRWGTKEDPYMLTNIIEDENSHRDEDIDEIRESYLLKKIDALRILFDNRTENTLLSERYEYQKQKLPPIFESIVVYNGYTDSKPFVNHENMISGKPSLIFQDISGYSTLIVEKLSYNTINKRSHIWDSIIVQAISYMCLFKEFKVDEIYVLFWKHYDWNISDLDREFEVVKIEINEYNISLFNQYLSMFNTLNNHGEITFTVGSINPNKCIKCSCRIVCNHKSGLIDTLRIPYETPAYTKKYPYYFTYEERVILFDKEFNRNKY